MSGYSWLGLRPQPHQLTVAASCFLFVDLALPARLSKRMALWAGVMEPNGHVPRVIDWPSSSFHRHVKSGHYSAQWGSSEPEHLNGLDFE